ncbi:MAG: hypothetical protein GX442_23805 [Candidatus Riflebacteria bacterium]|nr:hypothetical protein [Candidatus Riflebacteria bacterium]
MTDQRRGRTSFWLGTGLIVLAQVFLAWMALRALSQQAREEEERQGRDARTRVRQAALAFVRDGTPRWNARPALAFPASPAAAALPDCRLPDGPDDQATFLALATASGSNRETAIL